MQPEDLQKFSLPMRKREYSTAKGVLALLAAFFLPLLLLPFPFSGIFMGVGAGLLTYDITSKAVNAKTVMKKVYMISTIILGFFAALVLLEIYLIDDPVMQQTITEMIQTNSIQMTLEEFKFEMLILALSVLLWLACTVIGGFIGYNRGKTFLLRKASLSNTFASQSPIYGSPLSSISVSSSPEILCVNCKTPNPVDARYCIKCGAFIKNMQQQIDIVCHKCGTKLTAEMQFCPECGAKSSATTENH